MGPPFGGHARQLEQIPGQRSTVAEPACSSERLEESHPVARREQLYLQAGIAN
jgi:hypothetical protein